MKFLAALFLLLASTSGQTAVAPDRGSVSTVMPEASESQRRLTSEFETLRTKGFSGVSVVSLNGAILFAGASGAADPKSGRSFSVDTPVVIESLTKAFTAAAILKLQDQGRLAVHDPVSRFFPQASGPIGKATIHHLLTHSSGLPLFAKAGNQEIADPDPEPIGKEEFLERVLSTPLAFAPGARLEYSNAGYSLLAAIIEAVTKQRYEQFIADEILRPAGVDRIGYRAADLPSSARAKDGRTVAEASWGGGGPYWNLRGNGGFIADPREFVRWREAFAAGKIVSPPSVAATGTPWVKVGSGGEGYGWIVSQSARRGIVELAGGGGAMGTSDMRYYRDLGLAVFTSSNGGMPAGEVSGRLVAAMFAEPPPGPPPSPSPAHERLVTEFARFLLSDEPIVPFLESRIGPVFKRTVGLENIAWRVEALRKTLQGARLTGVEAAAQGSAKITYEKNGASLFVTLDFGGTPVGPRIAGFASN